MAPSTYLEDQFARRFSYLRLSVTDVCNFKCQYCLPNGYKKSLDETPDLIASEIHRLIQGFSKIGITKVRLTGGEPTTRRDLPFLVEAVRLVPEIKKIALTTNGLRFLTMAEDLYRAGVSAVNISIDSFDQSRFEEITGKKAFSSVLKAVDHALEVGFGPVKINTVLLKGFNDGVELASFFEVVKHRPVSLRFIELMQTGDNGDYFKRRHVSSTPIHRLLEDRGWVQIPRVVDGGPALEWRHPDFLGSIGIIAPYSKDFCKTCNRLRVTSRGKLRLCLFGDGGIDLRPHLHSDDQQDDLIETIRASLKLKGPSHRLHESIFGSTQNLSSVGG